MKAYVLSGFQYGDEGKGSWTDFFASHYRATGIVRYNGGMQAAHTVCVKDSISKRDIKHTFAHIGSSIGSKLHTYITENMIVCPQNLLNEAEVLSNETGEALGDILKRVHIHENCLVRTPYHKTISRIIELSSDEDKRRGTVGTGVSQVWSLFLEKRIGITIKQALGNDDTLKEALLLTMKGELKRVYDAKWQNIMRDGCSQEKIRLIEAEEKQIAVLMSDDFTRIQIDRWNRFAKNYPDILFSDYEDIRRCGIKSMSNQPYFHRNESLIYDSKRFIFEGSQGLLIDSKYGIHPNVTGVDTTMLSADRVLKRSDEVVKVGIVKPLCTRHGMGLFPTEMTKQELLEIMPYEEQQCSYWNGSPRYGWLDLVLLNYAQQVNKADYIVLSSLDKLSGIKNIPVCFEYKYNGNEFDKKTFDNLFIWHKSVGDIYIERIKNIDKFSCDDNRGMLRHYLKDCEPVYYFIEGWDKIDSTNAVKVTRKLREFIKNVTDDLETVGLSFGPYRQDKIMIIDI